MFVSRLVMRAVDVHEEHVFSPGMPTTAAPSGCDLSHHLLQCVSPLPFREIETVLGTLQITEGVGAVANL